MLRDLFGNQSLQYRSEKPSYLNSNSQHGDMGTQKEKDRREGNALVRAMGREILIPHGKMCISVLFLTASARHSSKKTFLHHKHMDGKYANSYQELFLKNKNKTQKLLFKKKEIKKEVKKKKNNKELLFSLVPW